MNQSTIEEVWPSPTTRPKVVDTLVFRRKGQDTKALLFQNEVGVYGVYRQNGPHIQWGWPRSGARVTFEKISLYEKMGFEVFTDDGAVLRPFNSEDYP